MNKKIKKIIAREGLIIIGITCVSILLMSVPSAYLLLDRLIRKLLLKRNIVYLDTPYNLESVTTYGMFLLLFSYPLYLATRFILWAMRALKKT